MNNFPSEEREFQLCTSMFQNMFPTINVAKVIPIYLLSIQCVTEEENKIYEEKNIRMRIIHA